MAASAQKNQHPRGLTLLFFTEMWERFSFYGMRALLVLYMTREIAYGDERAYDVYAAYGALVYATPFLGGLLADKLLGYRKAVIWGGVLMSIGHFLMAIEHPVFFYMALAFLIIGNGFFKPNISSMVGGLYPADDERRDGGFTVFYMGINIGALLAPLTCGLIGEGFGWHYGFGLAGIGMVAGLITFLSGQHKLGDKNGKPPYPQWLKEAWKAGISREYLVYLGSFVAVILIGLLVYNFELMTYILTPFAAGVLLLLLYISLKSEETERHRIWVIIILTFFSVVFWSFFEQAGSSINLFTDRNVDREILGFAIPASVFQSVNPAFIVILGPLFASMWGGLRKRGLEPSTPMKFSLGITQLGLGFGVLYLGGLSSGEAGMVALPFLLGGYLLHTTGELCLSPVGLSMVTKLSPYRIVAMVMGAWFLSAAFAHHLAGVVASYTSTEKHKVPAVAFESKMGETGNDVVVFSVQDASGASSDTLHMPVKISEEGPANQRAVQPDTFFHYASGKPGKPVKKDLRHHNLAPVGKYNQLRITKKPEHGSFSVDGHQIQYEARNGFSGRDTVQYNVCRQDEQQKCRHAVLVFTVSPDTNNAPVAERRPDTLHLPKRTFFSKFFGEAQEKVNVLNYFHDPDGDPLSIQFHEKPSLGFVKADDAMHPYVDSGKTVQIYGKVFFYIMVIAVAVGLLLIALVPVLRKWMHGVH